jgi:predicted transcriptional regulator
MKYRDRFEIISVILEIANDSNGVNKTKIMYKAFLPSLHLNQYLLLVIENGLIEYQERKRTYRTTEKGLRFLDLYRHLTELIHYHYTTDL